ncbi:MAG: ribosome maturation factor RimP [Acidimicrobiia bacterium]
MVERVRKVVEPLLESQSLEVLDIEIDGGHLRITVDRPGGVDLDAIGSATRAVSRALDEDDPIPSRYTLEVSSPGLERTLRRPDQFTRALGERVSVKTVPGSDGDRRITGTLVSADESGFVLRDDATQSERTVAYHEVERARTVFDWGPAPRPGKKKATA